MKQGILINGPKAFHDALLFQVSKTENRNEPGENEKDRSAEKKGEECELEGIESICGHRTDQDADHDGAEQIGRSSVIPA